MKLEKRSLAKMSLAAAALLLGVLTIAALVMTSSSDQALPSQAIVPATDQINKTSEPVIATATDAQAVKLPVTPIKRPIKPSTEISDGLSISGSVLNQQGEWLAGIEIIAAPRRVFSNQYDQQASERSTTTDADGDYRFAGLVRGDYRVRSVATPLYPSAAVTVRAGSDAVNLVLARGQDLWIYGIVKDRAGAPLGDVQIAPNGNPANETYSDAQGNFDLFHSLHGSARSQGSLRFSLDGYHKKRVVLRANDPYANELSLADVRLERIEGQADVRGNVSADHAPVPRARVFLRSTERTDSYSTRTDAGGDFALPDVAIGDYEIIVVPQGNYQDYSESDLKVTNSGLELSITLEPLQKGWLRGQMVDVQGRPVPNFSLWLTSLSARSRGARPISGDAQGRFELELPTGELRLATHSAPRIRLSGVSVSADDDAPVRLAVDVGDQVLEGSVIDSASNAVPGAQVSLIWSHQDNGVSSHALRNTTSDASGYVRFSQLGPGVHTVNVSAPGFQRQRIEHEVGVGGDVAIELQPLNSARSP